ncbi:MAG: DUF1937 family protein [Candidatus Caldarchaeum sp.]
MKLIYVSGPLTPKSTELAQSVAETQQNIKQAMRAWWDIVYVSLDEIGRPRAAPICPHLSFYLYQEFPQHLWSVVKDNRFWYDMDIAVIKKCDALYLLNGWEKSVGSRLEKEYAETNGIPTFTSIMKLAQYFGWI